MMEASEAGLVPCANVSGPPEASRVLPHPLTHPSSAEVRVLPIVADVLASGPAPSMEKRYRPPSQALAATSSRGIPLACAVTIAQLTSPHIFSSTQVIASPVPLMTVL